MIIPIQYKENVMGNNIIKITFVPQCHHQLLVGTEDDLFSGGRKQ
jgi:hypothetical protein